MCGIVGTYGGLVDVGVVRRMAAAIRHRGPDDSGVWSDVDAGIAFGHVRLSIVDLSPAGHQPMCSPSGRYTITYNGEIYNHLVLRKELEGAGKSDFWCGHSDTETILAGFDAWGIEATIRKCVGMFAFGVWDRVDRVLTLGRDRLGEKPLYYGWNVGQLLFASELSALKAHPNFSPSVDRGALTLLLRHNYIPAPYSIYQGITKVSPGTLITVSPQGVRSSVCYWDPVEVTSPTLDRIFVGSAQDAVDSVEASLKDAIKLQMVADVPVGAFLSGGIDSSTVVALMQSQASRPVRTFTIGFSERHLNEAPHANAVAKHLGTEHTELYVSSDQALNVVPRLAEMYSEPFGDSSQIPTALVCELARRDVKVSLSGDGGDELFGGYERYALANRFWRMLKPVPYPVRRAFAAAAHSLPNSALRALVAPIRGALPNSLREGDMGDRARKAASYLTARDSLEWYRLIVSLWSETTGVVLGGRVPEYEFSDLPRWNRNREFFHQMMALDLTSYLPDDILVKVDRASMNFSLESRVPLLDHRVVELAWRLPLSMKVREQKGKWPLRQILLKYVPRELVERPKMGFGVPLGEWLRGALRPWAEDLLSEEALRRQGFFQVAAIRKKWAEHVNSERQWHSQLWPVLMFQAWLNR